MTRKEAIAVLECLALEMNAILAGIPKSEATANQIKRCIDAYDMAISAIRQQEHVREVTKKVEPMTLDELSERNAPVFLPIKDFPNGGYWCLCENGYIIPPSGHGFMAKERPNWVFYRQKPEEVQK